MVGVMDLLERIVSEFDRAVKPDGRPLITLSYAQSLDGSIAARRGERLQISGQESARFTHQLRAYHDSVLVGIGTVLADDPQLTVRHVPGENPQPVILDSKLRIPLNSTLVVAHEPWIATTEHADPHKVEELADRDIQLLFLPESNSKQVSIPELLDCLDQRGIKNLMVEGGAEVISRLFSLQLVDFLILTVSPMILGGLSAVHLPKSNGSGFAKDEFPKLMNMYVEKMGDDLIVFGEPRWPESRES
jgi:3,4-dihydroxy 2-butanone 4-phosphate synthase/GTP cyclohydrolase II